MMRPRLVLALLPTVLMALCPHDCNRRGLCTGPGSDGYCFCEWGSTGDDCSIYICPSGDDPMTEDQQPRAINITTSASSGMLDGNFKLSFQGESIEFPADATLLEGSGCRAAVERLANVDEVECERHEVTEDRGAVYTVRILRWPVSAHMNNIYYHDGNPPVSDFACEVGDDMKGLAATGVRCVVTDAATENIHEYLPCSNHGVCNKNTGKCACHHGFKGAACSENLDREDKLLGWADSPFFSGNVARVAALRDPSPDFRLLKVEAGGADVATLRGDGQLTLHEAGLVVARGGATVLDGGITVSTAGAEAEAAAAERGPDVAVSITRGGIDVREGNVQISGAGSGAGAAALDVNLAVPVPGAGAEDTEAVTGASASVLKLRTLAIADAVGADEAGSASVASVAEADIGAGASPPARGTRLIEAMVGDAPRFEVDASGRTTVHRGGVEIVAGGARVHQGGLLVDSGGATIGDGGLRVHRGGVSVEEGGVSVEKGDVDVRNGGVTVTSTDAMRDVLAVTAQGDSFGGSVLKLDASGAAPATDTSAGTEGVFSLLRASAGGTPRFEVGGTGKTIVHAGGLHVLAGGARVATGGATIESGGIDVEGGVRVASGGIHLSGGGGFNVSDGGMHVSSSGDAHAALSVLSRGAAFVGTALRVEATSAFAGAGAGGEGFQLLDARVRQLDAGATDDDSGMEGTRSVFRVNGGGAVSAVGGIVAGEGAPEGSQRSTGVRSVGDLIAQSRAVLEATEVPASDVIVAPSTRSHVTITDDLTEAANHLSLQREGAVEGQLLLVHNADAQSTTGVVVPSGKAVLFVFSGAGVQSSGEWRPLTATEFDSRRLVGVTHLEAAGDLDVGKHTLAAARLRASAQRSGRIAMFGKDGEIVGHAGLEYSIGSDDREDGNNGEDQVPGTPTLHVQRLGAFEAAGDINMRGHSLKDVIIEGGAIHSIRELEVETLKIRRGMSKSELSVSSQAKGQLTFYGDSGALTGDDALLFRDGVLTCTKLAGFEATGDIDLRGSSEQPHRLLGGELRNGTVRGATLVEADHIRLAGATAGSLAIFGDDGDLTAPTLPLDAAGGGEDPMVSPAALRFDTSTGVMHAPAMSVQRVHGAMDFSAGRIANAAIVNGSAAGLTTVETSDLKITSQANGAGRVALFGDGGEIAGSDAFTFAEDTLVVPKLIFVEAAADVDFKGHTLRNAAIGPGSSVEGATTVRAQQIFVTGAADGKDRGGETTAGRLAVFGEGGSITTGPGDLRFEPGKDKADNGAASGGTLFAPRIGAFEAAGDINMNGFRMSDVQITKGGIEGVSGLQAYDVDLVEGVIRDVEINAISVAVQGTQAGDIAVFGEQGKLTGANGLRLDPADGTVSISRLGAFTAAGDADFKGHVIKDAKLRGSKTTLVGAAALSARRVAVTQQKESHLAVFGDGGELTGHKSLTFKDDTLAAPKLAGFTMVGDVLFDGHSLKDATITGGTINDVTLAVSGQQAGGLALYGENGKLTGHPALAFKDGTLWAARMSGFEVAGSIDMRRNKLSNAAIVDATIEGVDSLKVGSLTVEKQTPGQVAVFTAGGLLSGDAGLTFAAATLSVPKIAAFQAVGPIDFGAQKLSNVAISSGTIDGIDSLKVRSLAIEKQPAGSVAVFGSGGELTGDGGVSVTAGMLLAPKLGAFQAQGPIDFNSQRMSNVAITGGTVEGISRMKVQAFSVTSQVGGQVAIYGDGGTLLGDAGLTFRDGTLSAPQIGAFKTMGAVDFNQQPMQNVKVESGTIDGVSVVAGQTLRSHGDLEVAGDGSITGDLVVSGSVSGSGSFHDISDARFKHNISPLRGAMGVTPDERPEDAAGVLRTLGSLRGVSFEFGDRPGFSFPNGTQFGFLAQEVERVLPQIVQEVSRPGVGSYKTVAYSQVVPWLVEGVNAQGRLIESLSSRVEQQQNELEQVRTEFAAKQAATNERMAQLEAKLAAILSAAAA